MKKYYFHNGTEQEGPFSLEELKKKDIQKHSKIWYEELSDWTTAEDIDELKGLFRSTSPPPIEREKSSIPPVDNEQSKKTTEPNKSTTSWKSVFIKTAIAFAVILIVFAIYDANRYDSTEDSYYEKVMSVEETEQSQPTAFLSADGKYSENFWGDKIKVDGSITNSATVASFKDAVVRVTYYSKTKTVLGSDDYTIYEIFPPNSVKNFELKVENYKDVNTIGWDVIKAIVKY